MARRTRVSTAKLKHLEKLFLKRSHVARFAGPKKQRTHYITGTKPNQQILEIQGSPGHRYVMVPQPARTVPAYTVKAHTRKQRLRGHGLGTALGGLADSIFGF